MKWMSATGRLLPLPLVVTFTCLLSGCSSSHDQRADTATVSQIRAALTAGGASPEGSETASTAQPTGFAMLKGTFRLEGTPPPLTPINIVKDEAVCKPGGKEVFANDLVVDDASHGIANIVLYAENVKPDWVHESARPGKTDEIVFDQKECVFLTHVLAMQTSQKMRALNSDSVGHNLALASFNQTIPAGGFAIYQPTKELRAPEGVACSVHPWMRAYFINRDNGYFAVTARDGSFTIPNLPAGVPVEIRVWQEKIRNVTEVTVDGAAAKWPKGKLTVTLEPDQERTLNVSLDAKLFQ